MLHFVNFLSKYKSSKLMNQSSILTLTVETEIMKTACFLFTLNQGSNSILLRKGYLDCFHSKYVQEDMC